MRSYGNQKRKSRWMFFALCMVLLWVSFLPDSYAEGASKASKAKKAYSSYLKNIYKKLDFSGLEDGVGDIYFAVLDITGDNVPELLIEHNYYSPEPNFVYTYVNGRVKKLKTLDYYSGGDITAVYPKKHIIKAEEGDSADSDDIYYSVSASSIKVAARTRDGAYYVNGKKVAKARYSSYVAKLEKSKCYEEGNGKFKWRKNTKGNRKKYLK